MKRSSTWFALILIASALLLSAAANSENPHTRQTPKVSEPSNLIEQPAENNPTPLAFSPPTKTPTETPSPAQGGESSQDHSGVTLFLAIVTAVATVALAIFNFQLVGVTNEMKKVTADAAKAAEQSARSADLALNVQKPFVFVRGSATQNL